MENDELSCLKGRLETLPVKNLKEITMTKTSQSKNAPFAPFASALAPEGMLAFNRDTVEAYGRAWGTYLEAWNQCGRELMDFAASRLRKDTELGESLAKCCSWDETAEVHNDWMRATFDDYARETEKVMAIMNVAASRSQEAQTVVAGAKAKKSAASAASSDD
jgi:hypothetical protein